LTLLLLYPIGCNPAFLSHAWLKDIGRAGKKSASELAELREKAEKTNSGGRIAWQTDHAQGQAGIAF